MLLLDQGYWSACYGPHGLEIIHLRLAAGSEPGEAHCPCAASPRLLALKVSFAYDDPQQPLLSPPALRSNWPPRRAALCTRRTCHNLPARNGHANIFGDSKCTACVIHLLFFASFCPSKSSVEGPTNNVAGAGNGRTGCASGQGGAVNAGGGVNDKKH